VIRRFRQLFIQAKAHQGFRRYAANTSWMFAEQILRMVVGLLVGVWVARYLGPSQFGVFSYVVAFAALFSSIAKLGLDSIVVRDLVREPDQRNVYMGTAFRLKLAGSVVMLGAIGTAMEFTSSDITTKLYIFIIASGAVFQSFEVVDFYFQSKVLSKFVSICKLIQLFTSSLIKIYLIYIGSDLFWFVMVSLMDQITLAITLYLAYRYQKIGKFLKNFDGNVAKKLLGDSWPLLLSSFVIIIYMRIDQIMIKEILGEKEVGIYSAAVRLSEAWYFVPVIITNSLLPAILNAKKISEAMYYQRIQRLYTLMVWMAIGVALPITFLSEWVVQILYGPAFAEAGLVLAINMWTGVFVYFGSAWSKWMLIENNMKMAALFQINAMIFNVFLNIILIPKFGICGAAFSTLIAASIGHTILPLFIKSQRIALKMFAMAIFPIYIFKLNKNEIKN